MGLELRRLEEISGMEVIRITSSPDRPGAFYVGYSLDKHQLYEADIAFVFLLNIRQLIITQDREEMKSILENMLEDGDLELIKDQYGQYRLDGIDFDNKDEFISFCNDLLKLILRYGENDLNITMS